MLLLLPTLLLLWLPAIPSLRAMPTTPASPLQRRAPICHDLARQHLDIDLVDCIVALYSLPTTEPMGGVTSNPTDALREFSPRADPASGFRLPRHFAFGSCMIGVALANSGIRAVADSSSWNRVAQAAHRAIISCVQLPPAGAKVGGSELVGARAGIQVDVFRYQPHLPFLVDLNKPPPAPVARPRLMASVPGSPS